METLAERALRPVRARWRLPAALEIDIHEYYYRVGHMRHLNPAVLPQLARNIDAFIAEADSRG